MFSARADTCRRGRVPVRPADGRNRAVRRFVRHRKRIRRFPHVLQIDEMDCGAACLAMICRHYGRRCQSARIRELVHTPTRRHEPARDLPRAAEALGLAARSVQGVRRAGSTDAAAGDRPLGGQPLGRPLRRRARSVRVADPARGLPPVHASRVRAKWSGYAALFDYTEAFEQTPEQSSSLGWLWPFFRPLPARSCSRRCSLALLGRGLEMVIPVLTQVIVDT